MARKRRDDFFEEIERIDQVVNEVIDAERDALQRMISAPVGPAKSAALHAFRRAAAVEKKAVDRRQRFLDKHRP